MLNETDKIASVFLGKKTETKDKYDPSLLVAVPRAENRKQYDIAENQLPFAGFDIWHAYEFSCMTKNGIPVTRLMKMRYSCDNKYLIESKSLKLYLNSFNMTLIGECIDDCLETCKAIIEKDISKKLETDVTIDFIANYAEKTPIFMNYFNIMKYVDENSVKIEKFKEAPELIEIEENQESDKHFLKFDSLRSNCRVTHQPDFGDVFIYYKSVKHIKEESLLKYLCSFRSEYHFHEECCEMIYKRLFDVLDDNDELMVCALYTRRGGIDICPVRYSKNCSIEMFSDLIDTTKFARNSIKQ